MRRVLGVSLAVVILGAFSTTASAQDESWMNRWFWGAQAGTFLFKTPTQSTEAAFSVGGHWLITGELVGLHIAIDQLLFQDGTTSAVADGGAPNGIRLVNFSSGRRIQTELYAMPTSGRLQVFAGGGFAIHDISNAVAQGTFATPREAEAVARLVEEASTKAFITIGGGVSYRWGRWQAFGKYQFMPEGRDFLLSSEQHAITGGVRFSLAPAREDVTIEK